MRDVIILSISLLLVSCSGIRRICSEVDYINVSLIGFVGDGITDNTQAFRRLNNILSKSPKETIVIYFPLGVYCTFQGLEVYNKKSILIKGKKATIRKYAYNWSTDNIAFYMVNNRTISFEGICVDMRVLDANTPTEEAYRYYAIWCRMDKVPSEKVNISNCVFKDNLSVPNSKVKPYNGSIWLGSYGTRGSNVTIYNNIFENSCGRVIYATNMSNVKIERNTIKNASRLGYDCKYINQELICFRQISCDNVFIRKNSLTMSPSAYRFASHKVFEINCNDNDYLPLRNCFIDNNTINCAEAPDSVSCTIFNLASGENIQCRNNTIRLNKSRKSYFAYYNKSKDYQVLKNVMICDNFVRGLSENSIFLWGVDDIENLSIEHNVFYVNESFTSFHLGDPLCANRVKVNNNRIVKNDLQRRRRHPTPI